MKPPESLTLLATARSLCFGASLGAGLGLLLPYIHPMFATSDPGTMALAGGLIGTGLHQGIDYILVRGILAPIGRVVSFYGTLAEVILLSRGLPKRDRTRAVRRVILKRVGLIDGTEEDRVRGLLGEGE